MTRCWGRQRSHTTYPSLPRVTDTLSHTPQLMAINCCNIGAATLFHNLLRAISPPQTYCPVWLQVRVTLSVGAGRVCSEALRLTLGVSWRCAFTSGTSTVCIGKCELSCSRCRETSSPVLTCWPTDACCPPLSYCVPAPTSSIGHTYQELVASMYACVRRLGVAVADGCPRLRVARCAGTSCSTAR